MELNIKNHRKYLLELKTQLYCINKQFDKVLNINDITDSNAKLIKIYDSLVSLQMFLFENKEIIPDRDIKVQQSLIRSAFAYLELLETKLKNAKHIMFELSSKGKLNSKEDYILFTTDDDLLQQ